MDKKTMGNWIMYHEIHRLAREGLSNLAIAKYAVCDRRTIARYLAMNESEYEAFLLRRDNRQKILDKYELFVKERLMAAPGASAAQMLDWLKEHYQDLPHLNPKTVYNYVMSIRQKYNIPLETISREYFVVEELPYGQQAQADFGEYYLRNTEAKKKKVHFFTMMLSRSRMKYVHFSSIPFTTDTTIDAHEAAFRYFNGITSELVYDQDKLLLSNEQIGDLLLTSKFKAYVREQGLGLHFCRKSDPESKGKIENVVKYVKGNFLYGRVYYDIETLQQQVLGWLTRTGNGIAHSTTRKVPYDEWNIEQAYLKPWTPVNHKQSYVLRYLRIDNTFSFEGNFYSVPQGSYKKDVEVRIYRIGAELHVYSQQDEFLCKHSIAESKGNKVINTDHKRDKSQKLKVLMEEVSAMFTDSTLATRYFEMIREQKARYLRDQVLAIREAIRDRNRHIVDKVLERCVREKHASAIVFSDLLKLYEQESKQEHAPTGKIILLDPNSSRKAAIQPDKRDLGDYEKIFNS